MPTRLRCQLRASLLATLAAIILLTACWLLPGLVPVPWRTVGPVATGAVSVPYITATDKNIHYLQIDAILTPLGKDFHTSTSVTLRAFDHHYDRPEGGAVSNDRKLAINQLRTEFTAFCTLKEITPAAAAFDTVVGGSNVTLTVTYPERKHAAILMSLRPITTTSAWILLGVALPFTTIAAVRARRHRRNARANHCRGCGYNLTGIESSARCPECGRDPQTDRLNALRRAGRARIAVGSLLCMTSLVLAVTWWWSARRPVQEGNIRLISHVETDGISGRSLAIWRGGLTLVIIDFSPTSGVPYGGLSQFLGDLDPLDVSEQSLPPPIDWSLWHYTSTTSWMSSTHLWLSLWPPALLILIAGATLLYSGIHARRASKSLVRKHEG